MTDKMKTCADCRWWEPIAEDAYFAIFDCTHPIVVGIKSEDMRPMVVHVEAAKMDDAASDCPCFEQKEET